MSKHLKSILLHTLELAVILLGTFFIVKFLPVDSATVTGAVAVALGALVKAARSFGHDYVNTP
jgi:hypothetical protein